MVAVCYVLVALAVFSYYEFVDRNLALKIWVEHYNAFDHDSSGPHLATLSKKHAALACVWPLVFLFQVKVAIVLSVRWLIGV